jgi:tetratricopeptide (TPR) repeat protein
MLTLIVTGITVGTTTLLGLGIKVGTGGVQQGAASPDAPEGADSAPMSGDFNIAIAQFQWLGIDASDSNHNSLAEEFTNIATEAVAHVQDELGSSEIKVDYRKLNFALAGNHENEQVDYIEKEIVSRLHADVVLLGNVETILDGRATQVEVFFYISDRRIPDAESLTAKLHAFGSPIVVTGSIQRNATVSRDLKESLTNRMVLLSDFVVAIGEYGRKRYSEAERKLQEIEAQIQVQPDIWDTDIKVMLYFFLGTVAGERHDFINAQQYYEQVLLLDRNYARAQLGLAQLKFIQAGLWPERKCAPGRVDEEGLQEAIRLHEEALVSGAYSPYDDTPTRTRFLLAQVYACTAASRTNPEDAHSSWQKALDYYQRTIDDYRQGGDRYRLGDLAARAYAGRGLVRGFSNVAGVQDIEQAIGDYREALQLSREPDQKARFHAKIAELYLMQNQCREAEQERDEADRAYTDFLNTNPGYEDEPLKSSLETLKSSIAQVCQQNWWGLFPPERKPNESPIASKSISATPRKWSGYSNRHPSSEQLYPQPQCIHSRYSASA